MACKMNDAAEHLDSLFGYLSPPRGICPFFKKNANALYTRVSLGGGRMGAAGIDSCSRRYYNILYEINFSYNCVQLHLFTFIYLLNQQGALE